MKYRFSYGLILLALLFLVALGCSSAVNLIPQGTEPTPTSADIEPSIQPINTVTKETQPFCGDGVCDGPENHGNCSQDCGENLGEDSFSPEDLTDGMETYWVVNPSSGERLFVTVVIPPLAVEGGRYPALVLVPGGAGGSGGFLGKPSSTANRLAERAFVVVAFDPDGRGRSGGEGNLDGFVHQDGLAEVIRFTAGLPYVNNAYIGLLTYSYGITMGTGALARYPDLPVAFLMDWEGPADRYDTAIGGGTIQWSAMDDEVFWREREALNFMPQVQVPYRRIQTNTDHVQPDNSHAVYLINAAESGLSPWTQLNAYPPNRLYDPENPPEMLADEVARELDQLVAEYADEMMDLHGGSD